MATIAFGIGRQMKLRLADCDLTVVTLTACPRDFLMIDKVD